ncbi:hypothetical protein [Planctomicrobium piriforme]|uniref:Uncharacterized protein n=1 Tax=Planctomicrobium piriforme TaxID=1576369 RepID=A0A1I3Q1M0_9PLAN|nr:hypothetical protein [Planctomicrobium piriforme]SFJ27351.1 hypothetical protein SAMN05421753_117102 [Planctomicrobium piriforme]
MKSLSAALIVFAGVGLFWIGYAEHPDWEHVALYKDQGKLARYFACMMIVIALLGWWRTLGNDRSSHSNEK